ncbi:glycogen synthase [Chloroflexi bacterium CFX5]|nr:starch synthase [Chloroflexota bacterium]MDL1920550.1 glycogen synthase [Chloroflexi bacterium CFX5]NUQ59861.1 glycogen synthase [Anaerolineales bacterium]
MPKTINVLFLAAEADPFIKVGGLGDVAGTLPRELRALSTDELKVDVRLVLPYHAAVKAENLRPVEIFSLPRGDSEVGAETFETSIEGMPVYLINGDPIRASGSVYSFDAKLDTEKYAFFSLAAAELPKHIHWQPDVIHANDWHTALSLYANLTKRWESGSKHVAGVISLHNLPFMGAEAGAALESYGVKLAQTDLPDWARVLPLPLGMWASDAIVAVSPGYANEILAEEFGCGLQGFLSLRRDSLSGILNGIDAVSFDPATDKALGVNYDLERLKLRAENKELLQGKLGLARNPHIPLLGIVSRMDVQKGVDLAFSALKGMKRVNFQAVILGTGDPKLEESARELQNLFPEKIKAETRFDANLARQIYAGADILLMPSRYEPCGLSQMIAMRYGCVPVVRAVGGLKDTVVPNETGFVFEKAHRMSLMGAIKSAIKTLADREKWSALQRNGMSRDFSWKASAKKYLELYESLVK